MKIDIVAHGAATAARVGLEAGETLTAEYDAMIAVSSNVQIETSTKTRGGSGGVIKGIKRMFSGENFFLNHFTAQADAQEVIVGPSLAGHIVHHRLDGGSLVVQGSSWLASSAGVDIDTTWAGLSAAFFSGEGLFWVKCSGRGEVLVNSFGAVYEVDVTDGYVVDTGHIVAFEDTLKFSIGKAGASLVGSLLGGEGLVCRFTGQGKLYCQTHNPPSFGRSLGPLLKPRRN